MPFANMYNCNIQNLAKAICKQQIVDFRWTQLTEDQIESLLRTIVLTDNIGLKELTLLDGALSRIEDTLKQKAEAKVLVKSEDLYSDSDDFNDSSKYLIS